jgi:hypothetical protein
MLVRESGERKGQGNGVGKMAGETRNNVGDGKKFGEGINVGE